MDTADLLDIRVALVTGKGGVGKSTVAAALAIAATRTGRRTCLVEVEGRQTFSRLFGTQPWDFSEREFRPGLYGLSLDPEASLAEYLEMFYGAKRISKLVVGNAAVEFATTAAPGIKDVLLIGKVREMERRRDDDGRFHYDSIVVDAPPTGRIVNFLRAPEATTELVSVGPVRHQAQSLVDMLLDPARTCALLVTLLEEMPVTETLESTEALRRLGMQVGPVVVNRVLPRRFADDERKALTDDLEVEHLARVLDGAGLEVDTDAAQLLLDRGREELARIDLQDSMRERLTEHLDSGLFELPEIYADDFAADEVGLLADRFEEAWQ